jgi:transcriptional regulator with XRE-family HTH domain
LEGEFRLAEELIRLRSEKKMSRSELAKKSHTPPATITHGDTVYLKLDVLRRIDAVLGVAPELSFYALPA